MDVFHVSTKAWFDARYGTPTQAQVEAWPLIAMGTTNNIVRGQLVEGLEEECVCDLRNYEVLLRSLRAHRSESFEPVPIARIALHTAQLQGLTNGTCGHEGLSDIL